MMTLPLFSQKPSSDSIRCVPVSALRNAMIMKTEFDKTKIILSDCRDSISILNNIVLTQDTLISTKEQKIKVLSDNIVNYEEIVTKKDEIIGLKDKEIKYFKKQRNIGYGVSALAIILSLLIVL
jgi:hypothetical protein